jgi:hypothetical protein
MEEMVHIAVDITDDGERAMEIEKGGIRGEYALAHRNGLEERRATESQKTGPRENGVKSAADQDGECEWPAEPGQKGIDSNSRNTPEPFRRTGPSGEMTSGRTTKQGMRGRRFGVNK